MDRRTLLKAGAGVLAAMAAGVDVAWAKTRGTFGPITVSQIIQAAWPQVLDIHQRRDHEYRTFLLDFRNLGVSVEFVPGVHRDIQQVQTPVVWAKSDEAKLKTPHDKIQFVETLLTNTLQAHQFALAQVIGERRAVISKTYYFDRSEIVAFPNRAAYTFSVYTALAVE